MALTQEEKNEIIRNSIDALYEKIHTLELENEAMKDTLARYLSNFLNQNKIIYGRKLRSYSSSADAKRIDFFGELNKII